MTESPPLQATTPKRKRDNVINEKRTFNYSPGASTLSRGTFSFQAPVLKLVEKPDNDIVEDGNSSPRSKVAQKFQELALGSGGGVISKNNTDGTVVMGTGDGIVTDEAKPLPRFESPRFSPDLPVFDFDGVSTSSLSAQDMQLDDDDNASRKRVKLPDSDRQDLGLDSEANTADPGSVESSESSGFVLQTAVDPSILRTIKSGGSGRLRKSYPSINRLSDSKSRRRRAGTPPLVKRKPIEPSIEEDEPIIVDPVRAALTWHEDEITVYDPEDQDDDGTGINGIGFKPTAAVAHARAQKRRQQLADYRKREESEARAKRNQRRRQRLGGPAELERKHSMVRVHFSEAEPTTVVTN
ncbi:hypothetical protein M426DRAFT_325537 [Hypoxylon sp. CI-4A]|nr:hypothetical protein M426DRAFT_325537 [Hypoxylon sp. CI-4A]